MSDAGQPIAPLVAKAIAEMPKRRRKSARTVAAEAYQVIGALAHAGDLFDHPEVIRALDYFSLDCPGEILPFGGGLPEPPPAA